MAEKQAERVAVVSGKRELSYGELLQGARSVAEMLVEAGVRTNELVGVCMDKGWEQVVAVVGTEMAGGAYLPMDPSWPRARLEHLVRHGEVRVVLVQPWLEESVEWPAGVEKICVDEGTVRERWARSVEKRAGARDLAYVIYTSGSTGQPKGVMIEHRSALNTILDVNERLGVGREDRVLGVSALTFDLSVYDVFGVLGAGGTLVLPSPEEQRDPARWAELVQRHGVTLWNSVPALMELLVEQVERRGAGELESLRHVMLSGDWIPLELPGRVKAVAGRSQVMSLGGATEGSIWSICHAVQDVRAEWKSIPYGRAMKNQQIHVLDWGQEPSPEWVPGELYIGGLGVARGYWRDEERTRAQFSVQPGSGEPLYRTGDWGRYLPDGTVEFLGREDQQVKVAGYRIELGEVEAALGSHPGVERAVAAVVGAPMGERRLVGYVVARDTGLSEAALRPFLLGKLPEYMIPSQVVFLDELPLSANGKVDRKALPLSSASHTAQPRGDEPARPVPRRIRALVAQALGTNEFSDGTDLMSVGMTSIQMIRLATSLDQEFGVRPQLDELFRLRDLQQLSEYYEAQLTGVWAPQPAQAPSLPQYALVLDPDEREAFRRTRRDIGRFDGTYVALPLDQEILERLGQRRSHRSFVPQPVSTAQLGGLLTCLASFEREGTRKLAYASAGTTYAVQTYLHVKAGRVEGLAEGSYYHRPDEHRLVLVEPGAVLDRRVHFVANRAAFDECAFSIFLVCDLSAIAPLYGTKSLDFARIEAGSMSQLLESRAAELGLGLCGIGHLEEAPVRELLHLENSDVLVYSLIGGRVDWEEGEI
jgi:amino acid adenylation domain-containing protein